MTADALKKAWEELVIFSADWILSHCKMCMHINLLKMFFGLLNHNTYYSDWTIVHPIRTAASLQLCFKGHSTSPVLSQLITGRLTSSNSVFNVNLFEILIWMRTLWGIQSINSEPKLPLHIKWVPSLTKKFIRVRKKLQTQHKKRKLCDNLTI